MVEAEQMTVTDSHIQGGGKLVLRLRDGTISGECDMKQDDTGEIYRCQFRLRKD